MVSEFPWTKPNMDLYSISSFCSNVQDTTFLGKKKKKKKSISKGQPSILWKS